jgi:hypothetical protein
MARQVSRGVSIAPGGAKLVHAQLMRPIGRSRNVVRIVSRYADARTLQQRSLRGKLCRWSHLISSAKGQRNCWPTLKVCGATRSVKYQPCFSSQIFGDTLPGAFWGRPSSGEKRTE